MEDHVLKKYISDKLVEHHRNGLGDRKYVGDDRAGFSDVKLAESIEQINWYQTKEEIEADDVWVRTTTAAIIGRRKARQEAERLAATDPHDFSETGRQRQN